MNEYLITHIIVQIFLSIPLFFIIVKWKKINLILKIIIISTFTLTLPFLWNTIFHNPVNYEVDITQKQAGKDYEFEFYPGIKDVFVAGFQIKTKNKKDTEILFEQNKLWPSVGNNDVEVIIGNKEEDEKYTKTLSDGGIYANLDIHDRGFLYAKYVKFDKPLKKTRIVFRFKTDPPENIESINLDLSYVYFNDLGIVFFLENVFSFILVYGSILLYFLISTIFKKIKNKQESLKRKIIKSFIVITVVVVIALSVIYVPQWRMYKKEQEFIGEILKKSGVEMKSAPKEIIKEFSPEEIINILLPQEEIEKISSPSRRSGEAKAILFDYGEKGKTLSYQKYFDLNTFSSFNLLIDRPIDIRLRHKIKIGTDMRNWEFIKKETNDSTEGSFRRTYVLVQRRGESGRAVGLCFFEGAMVTFEVEGVVDDSTIKNLVEVTWNTAELLEKVYKSKIKNISEGDLFKNEPIHERPDLPDPDF